MGNETQMQHWQNSKPARQCLALISCTQSPQVKVCPWCREELPVSSFTGHLGLEQVPELSPASAGTNCRGCVHGRLSVHFILLPKKNLWLANFRMPLKLDLGGVSKYIHINFPFFKHCFSGAHLHKNRPWFQSMFLNGDNFYTCFILCGLQKLLSSLKAQTVLLLLQSLQHQELPPPQSCSVTTITHPAFPTLLPFHISVSACSFLRLDRQSKPAATDNNTTKPKHVRIRI